MADDPRKASSTDTVASTISRTSSSRAAPSSRLPAGRSDAHDPRAHAPIGRPPRSSRSSHDRPRRSSRENLATASASNNRSSGLIAFRPLAQPACSALPCLAIHSPSAFSAAGSNRRATARSDPRRTPRSPRRRSRDPAGPSWCRSPSTSSRGCCPSRSGSRNRACGCPCGGRSVHAALQLREHGVATARSRCPS